MQRASGVTITHAREPAANKMQAKVCKMAEIPWLIVPLLKTSLFRCYLLFIHAYSVSVKVGLGLVLFLFLHMAGRVQFLATKP